MGRLFPSEEEEECPVKRSSLLPLLLVCLLLPGLEAQVDAARDDYNFAAGLYDRGMHDRAVGAFQRYLAQHRNDRRRGKAYFYLGQAQMEIGKNAEALKSFKLALRNGLQEFSLQCRFRIGELQHRLGQNDAAVQSLGALLRADGLGGLAEAARYFHAEACLAVGQVDRARESHRAVVEGFGDGHYAPWSASALGFMEFDAGRYGKAEGLFARAAKAPDAELALEASVMRGECLLRGKDPEGALRAFQAASKKKGGKGDARCMVGVARSLLALERTKEALRAFRSAAESHPENQDCVKALIRSAAILHERKLDKQGLYLLDLAERGAQGQQAKDLAYWRGILSSESGSLEEGIAHLTAAVKAGGGARRKFSLADALSRAGRHEEAVSLFAEVSKESDDAKVKSEARFAEAYSWNRLGRHEKAVGLLRRLDRDGAREDLRADAIFALGENYFAMERFEEALKCYRRLSGGPGERHGHEALYKQGWSE